VLPPWLLACGAAVLLGACALDQRDVSVSELEPVAGAAGQDPGLLPPDERPCLTVCPADDACRDYQELPPGNGPDAGCLTAKDCPFEWKPAARDGEACRCEDGACLFLRGEACSLSGACEGGSCVATADGSNLCCAATCEDNEVCMPDGSGCMLAEPCTEDERRCSGALHQSCVDGSWQTLTDCGALGCSSELDGCLRAAGQACESDADCGEGSCLPTADGNSICCTGACNTSCQRCTAEGTECAEIEDDEACGAIECPMDPCRTYDPASVVSGRCRAGQCATVEEACTAFLPQRAELECSPTALCDEAGGCSLPKRELLDACSSNQQCAGGACVATANAGSACCSRASVVRSNCCHSFSGGNMTGVPG
jgi:hypothetical protein